MRDEKRKAKMWAQVPCPTAQHDHPETEQSKREGVNSGQKQGPG
jgi:hypothetical protein